MSFFTKIIAFFMAVLTFVFPWMNKEEHPDPNSYIIEDKCLTVCLTSNPSTGYNWTYDIYGESVKSESENFYSDNSNEDICGAPGVAEYKFVAVKEGEFEIVFQYLRAWEDMIPERRVTISGTVDKNGNITVDNFEC